jgi:repressor LexA
MEKSKENISSLTQESIDQRFRKMIEILVPKRIKSKNKLAEMLGTNQSHINIISLGTKGRHATPEMISRALQTFPDINPSWLLGHVEEPIFLQGNLKALGSSAEAEYVDLPFINVSLRATFTESIITNTQIETETIRIMYANSKLYQKGVVFEVDGDSMEPNYVPGARVLALPIDAGNWQYLSSGVYAICFGSSFVLKRVKDNQIMAEGILTLHSDNPSGGSMPVKREDIRAVWKVEQIVYSPAR